MANLNEEAGVSLWRQIGEALIADIESGALRADARLPSSSELASRFGVNRHTVLRAIAHLQAAGYLRIERGRGTYAVVNRMDFHIGPRRWFEQNLLESKKVPSRTVIEVADIKASKEIASFLALRKGAPLVLVKLLGEADGVPVNYGVHYLSSERLPGIRDAFPKFGNKPTKQLSFSKILKSVGVLDFRRKHVRIRSRLPSSEEAWHLRMPPTEHVLETDVTQVNGDDVPIVYAQTCYCSSRVELVLDL
jgi:GntR family phosphonate transport system transcriptional regulator